MKGALIIIFFWFLAMPAGTASEIPDSKNPGDSVSAYLDQALIFVYEDFPKALALLNKADSLSELSGNLEDQSHVAHSFGLAYYVKGDYGISLQYFLKASELFRKRGDMKGIAKGLIGQGLIQQGIDRHSEAINLFRQAIEAYKQADAYASSNPAYLDIAISEIELKEYQEARRNLERAIALSREAGRKDVEHMSLNKLGELSFLEGDAEKSLAYHNMVLFDKTEPTGWEKSFAHAGLAQAFRKQRNLGLAQEHGLMAMNFAEKTQSLWDLERNSKILAEVYFEMDSVEKAYEYLSLNQKYKDSLYDQEKLREINLMQLESKESENQRLLVEKEAAEKRLFINRVVTFLLVLLTLFLILLLVLFQKKKKQEQVFHQELEEKNRTIVEQNQLITEHNRELDEVNKSKDRFFSILSHDLKSPIGSIQQLLEMMKSGDFTPEEQSELLDEMLKQISGTSFMLHNLLYWANSQLEGNRNKPQVIELAVEMDKVLRAHYWPAKQKNINISHEVLPGMSKIKVDKDQLSVILHNLVSNAIKFTVEGKGIHISYEERGAFLQLTISDGGIGMTPEKINEIKSMDTRMLSERGTGLETGTGLGLLLVKEFLKANRAQLEIQSSPGVGSDFIISFLKAPH